MKVTKVIYWIGLVLLWVIAAVVAINFAVEKDQAISAAITVVVAIVIHLLWRKMLRIKKATRKKAAKNVQELEEDGGETSQGMTLAEKLMKGRQKEDTVAVVPDEPITPISQAEKVDDQNESGEKDSNNSKKMEVMTKEEYLKFMGRESTGNDNVSSEVTAGELSPYEIISKIAPYLHNQITEAGGFNIDSGTSQFGKEFVLDVLEGSYDGSIYEWLHLFLVEHNLYDLFLSEKQLQRAKAVAANQPGAIYGPDSDEDENAEFVENIIDTIQREAILFSAITGIQEDYDVGNFISYFDDYGDEEALAEIKKKQKKTDISGAQSESPPVTKSPQGEVDMEITEFTYSGPDGDGDISWNMNTTVKNDTEHVVELIKTSCLVFNADNICVGGSYDDDHDEFIDPGDSVSMNLNPGYMKEPVFGGQLDKNKMIVNATLFRREFNKLGEIKVPEDYTDCTFLETTTNVGGIVDIMGATCKRQEPDDDGDVSVGVEVGVRNVTDSYIERVTLKMVVRDEEDSNIEESEDYYHLAPHAGRVFSMSMYAKAGKLRNSTIRLSAAVFFPVGYKNVEVTAVEEEE